MAQFVYLGMTANVVGALKEATISASKGAEVCGLLGGFLRKTGLAVAMAVYPLSNLSLLKHSFAVDAEEFCRERDAIKQKGLVPLALYHSHLDGSTAPSSRDRKLPWITDLPLLILAWNEGELRLECYGDVDGRIVPISVVPYYDLEASREPSHE